MRCSGAVYYSDGSSAMLTAYLDESDISIVLHRTALGWTIVGHHGDAYDRESLKTFGVPQVHSASLLKAYAFHDEIP